jgi:hypothetical protein
MAHSVHRVDRKLIVIVPEMRRLIRLHSWRVHSGVGDKSHSFTTSPFVGNLGLRIATWILGLLCHTFLVSCLLQYPQNGTHPTVAFHLYCNFCFSENDNRSRITLLMPPTLRVIGKYFWPRGRSLVFLQVRGTLTLYNYPYQQEVTPKNRNHTPPRHPRGADTCHICATYLAHMTKDVIAFILILTCCLFACQLALPDSTHHGLLRENHCAWHTCFSGSGASKEFARD